MIVLGLVWSDAGIEEAMLGRATGALDWGPKLFRMLLVLHGLLLAVVTVSGFRRQDATAAMQTGQPLTNTSWRHALPTLLVLCLIATALRLYRLDTDLWIDEVATLIGFVRPSLGESLTSFPSQNQHMLYTLLAKGTFYVWGESAWSLRLPAVMFGVLSIPTLFLLGRELVNERYALKACALMTLSYHHVWFSQNARGYTGLLFFTLVATWLWIHALPRNRMSLWFAYVTAIALGTWVHMTMVFVALAHGLTFLALLLWGKPNEMDRKCLGNIALGSWWMPCRFLIFFKTRCTKWIWSPSGLRQPGWFLKQSGAFILAVSPGCVWLD